MAAKKIRWWEAKRGSAVRRAVVDMFSGIDGAQTILRDQMARNLGMLENRQIDSLDMAAACWGASSTSTAPKENVIRSASMAATAKISTNKPRPFYATNGADWSLRKQARQRQLFADAVLYRTGAYALARQVFRDATIWPVGLLKAIADAARKEVRLERVLRSEIAVDPLDGRYGAPRSMFQHQIVSRSVLTRRWGASEATDNAGLVRRMRDKQDGPDVEDPVSVIEAWHLPTGPGAKDGRHVICTDGGDPLLDEKWTRERFPFAVWRWSTAGVGWDGVPMADELMPYQAQIDELNTRIRTMMRNTTLRCLVPKGAKIDLEQLNNSDEIPICEYAGGEPKIIPDASPPPHLLMERERLKAAAFEQVGLSQLLAQSQKPPGLDSGKALREYKDTESQRFMDVGAAWDDFFCSPGGIVEVLEDAADDLAEAGVDLELFGAEGQALKPVRWSDARKSRDSMRLQVMPSAFLPTTPAGKMAAIQEMAGLAPMASQLLIGELDSPDIEATVGVITAPLRAILADMDKIEDLKPGDDYPPPEPFLDLELARTIALSRYLRAREAGAPEHVQAAFRGYLLDIKGQMDEAKAAESPQAMPPGALPGMPPGGPVPGGAGAPPAGLELPPELTGGMPA